MVAAFFLAAGPSPAKVIPLGTVTHAERAHVGQAAASVGTTIYEGDRLSTDDGGKLRIAANATALLLDAQSSLTLFRSLDPQSDIVVELVSGTLVFSATPSANLVVMADDASVRPVGKGSTITHVRVVNAKELRIFTQQGPVTFSYHGDSEVIPEGKAYRVFLDPPKKDAGLGSDQGTKPPGTHPRTFLLVAIIITAGIAIPVAIHTLESPDRP